MPIPKGGFDDYLEGLGEEAVARDLGTRVVPREARVAADRGIDGIDGAMSTLSPSNHNLWPLLEGLGLTHTPIPDEKVADFLMDVGLALRQVIEGLHGVFSDQDQGGDATFRVATSQLQPLEDNPLKFAADADEAVDLLFGQRRAVHLGPRAAVAECLEGLRLHRSAVAAGTAEGLRTVIESFAPTTLARRFAKYDPSRADTRDSPWLWAMYEQYFEEVLRNRTHGLTRLFQEVLTQTYDRHIRDAMAPAREADDQRGQASFQTMT
jgi:type VI secretion system protein ImpI